MSTEAPCERAARRAYAARWPEREALRQVAMVRGIIALLEWLR